MPCLWIDRASLCGVMMCLAGLTACGGDDVPTENDSSSEGGSSSGNEASSTVAPTTTAVDESSSSSGASTDASESESGTGTGPAGPDVRVLFEPDSIANDRPLDMVDVIDGVHSAPVTVIETTGTAIYERVGDHWLAVAAVSNAAVSVVDLASASPPTTWLLDTPKAATTARVTDTNADGSLWVLTTSDGTAADIQVHPIAADGPGLPWDVDGDLDPTTSSGEVALVQGDTRVAFRADDEDGASIWLGPAQSDAPALEQLVEVPGVALFGPNVAATGNGLIYRTGGLPTAADAAWFVDLASDPIGEAQPIALLDGKQSFGSIRFAPDGSGVATTQEAIDETVDLVWVPIEDGAPGAAQLVSSGALAGNAPFTPAWSPDSRWLAFASDAPRTLYVSRIDAGVPGEPIAISDPGIAEDVVPGFTADSSHGYYLTEELGVTTIVRVPLAGDTPGAVQTVSAGLERFQQYEIIVSGDLLCYVGAEAFEDPLGAWCVDVSGDEPAAPERIDEGLDAEAEEEVVQVVLSEDGNYVLYAVATDEGLRKVLLDRTTGVSTSLVEGETSGYSLLFGLR